MFSMSNQQLFDYIKKQSEQGVSRGNIRQTLLDAGWGEQDVEEALTTVLDLGGQNNAASTSNSGHISPMEHFLNVFRKYAVFSGRAQRAEYWYFVLFSFIIQIVLSIIDGIIFSKIGISIGVLSDLYVLAVLIPEIAVGVRRLHDIGKSGWMILISFIPIIGSLWLLILFVQDSEKGTNKYGPNPKAA